MVRSPYSCAGRPPKPGRAIPRASDADSAAALPMTFVTQKQGGTGHPFLGAGARSKEQEERSLEQIGRPHTPSPRSWEPMGRSLEIFNLSKEQTDRALERTSGSKEETAHSLKGTNPPLPIPRASDADRDAIAALVQRILDLKGGSGVPPKISEKQGA